MKAILRTTGIALLGLTLTGCLNGGDSSSSSDDNEGPEMTEQTGTEFIIAELENTTDTRDAVNISDKELSFDDQQAIDALF